MLKKGCQVTDIIPTLSKMAKDFRQDEAEQ